MLTPQDIENKQFTVVRLREGYAQQEVDDFLDTVRAAYADLYRTWQARMDAPTQAITIPEQITQASKLLELAQQAAKEQEADAAVQRDKVITGARQSGQQIIQDAKAEATRLLEEATKEKHAEVGRLMDEVQKLQSNINSLENHRKQVAERLAAALREVSNEARNED